MRPVTKVLLLCALALCVILAVTLLSPTVAPTGKNISVVETGPGVKVIYCALHPIGSTSPPALYLSRGRLISRTYYEREAYIYRYLDKHLRVRPIHESHPLSHFWQPELVLALRLPKAQAQLISSGTNFPSVRLTDAQGATHTDSEGPAFRATGLYRVPGLYIDWSLSGNADRLKPPVTFVITAGDGTMLAKFRADKW